MSFHKTMVLSCVFSLMAHMAWAQAPQDPASGAATRGQIVSTGGTRLHGTVTDPDGELIPGATITLTPAHGPAVKAKSGSDGTYALTVVPGSYTLLVSMPGFASYVMTNLRVPPVPSTTVDAKLKIGEETTVVNVDANTVQLAVDPDSNASSMVLKGADLAALSDDPDELSSELSALAGPSVGPNGGQIYVDGFTGGQLPPKSSIREIRINQNPFSAQYERLGYGRVEVFTKPGTDKLHGSFQINGNTSQFNTGNPLQASDVYQPPYHTVFMFGSLTGPLGKRASYSVSGSHRDIEDDAFTNVTVLAPGVTASTNCLLVQCTQNSQISTYTPQVRTDISPRFDFALGEKNVLTARIQYVQNDQTNQGVGGLTLPSAAYNTSGKSAELQLSDTQTWSSRLINETRFEYERERSSTASLSNAPYLIVSGTFQNGGSSEQNNSDHQDHIEVQNYTSLQLKKNFLRFGGRLRSTREAINSQANTNGQFIYSYLTNANNNGVCTSGFSSYQCGTISRFSFTRILQPNVGYTFTDVGLYAESDWKVRPNLTVSYGIRYETQNHLDEHHDFAPRVSFAYGVGKGQPKTVVRGGFGLFYDRFGGNNILTLIRQAPNSQIQNAYTISNPPACTPANPTACCAPTNVAACTTGVTASSLTSYVRTPNLRTPYIVQFAGGVDQQLSRVGSVSVNYLHSQGVHQLATQNIGYPTTGLAAGQQATPNYQYFSEGVFRQDQLIVNGNVRTSQRVSLFGFYQLGFAKGDTSGAGSAISTPYNIAADYGRTSFDVRHRYLIAGSISLPFFIQFSPFVNGQSGSPYNVTIGDDVNRDTFYNDRAYLVPTGTTSTTATVKSIGCGTFASSPVIAGAAVAPINACTGPALFTFNLRATKTFGFGESRNAKAAANGGDRGGRGGPGGFPGAGDHNRRGGPPGSFGGGGGSSTGQRYNLTLGVQVQNLFNNADYASPNGTLASPQFGQTTQLAGRQFTGQAAVRRLSLQASFNF